MGSRHLLWCFGSNSASVCSFNSQEILYENVFLKSVWEFELSDGKPGKIWMKICMWICSKNSVVVWDKVRGFPAVQLCDGLWVLLAATDCTCREAQLWLCIASLLQSDCRRMDSISSAVKPDNIKLTCEHMHFRIFWIKFPGSYVMPCVDAWRNGWEIMLHFTMSMCLNVFPLPLQGRCFLHWYMTSSLKGGTLCWVPKESRAYAAVNLEKATWQSCMYALWQLFSLAMNIRHQY